MKSNDVAFKQKRFFKKYSRHKWRDITSGKITNSTNAIAREFIILYAGEDKPKSFVEKPKHPCLLSNDEYIEEDRNYGGWTEYLFSIYLN